MKKKVFSAFLFAAALMVAPITNGLTSLVAVASSNNTVNPNNTVSPNNTVNPLDLLADEVMTAESGAVIQAKEGITTLSNSVMHELVVRGDVTLVMRYTYEGVDYVITIPAGGAEDNDIEWYGPLYLAAHYGNGAAGAVGASYTVQPGDTMSGIARAVGMTLNQLAAKNPQISDVNKIYVGQEINLN